MFTFFKKFFQWFVNPFTPKQQVQAKYMHERFVKMRRFYQSAISTDNVPDTMREELKGNLANVEKDIANLETLFPFLK